MISYFREEWLYLGTFPPPLLLPASSRFRDASALPDKLKDFTDILTQPDRSQWADNWLYVRKSHTGQFCSEALPPFLKIYVRKWRNQKWEIRVCMFGSCLEQVPSVSPFLCSIVCLVGILGGTESLNRCLTIKRFFFMKYRILSKLNFWLKTKAFNGVLLFFTLSKQTACSFFPPSSLSNHHL